MSLPSAPTLQVVVLHVFLDHVTRQARAVAATPAPAAEAAATPAGRGGSRRGAKGAAAVAPTPGPAVQITADGSVIMHLDGSASNSVALPLTTETLSVPPNVANMSGAQKAEVQDGEELWYGQRQARLRKCHMACVCLVRVQFLAKAQAAQAAMAAWMAALTAEVPEVPVAPAAARPRRK